jgi:hypothetical protein
VPQIGYANIPRIIGLIVSKRYATLHDLKTVIGMAEAYDLVEIISVDAYNNYLASKK